MTISPAFLSGLCAAFAGIFGKLSGLEYTQFDVWSEYFIKLLCFIIMIILNGMMWSFFVRALQSSKSSLEATVLSTATNYVLSGLFAYIMFGELTGILWWSGVVLILCGVNIIAHSSSNTQTKSSKL